MKDKSMRVGRRFIEFIESQAVIRSKIKKIFEWLGYDIYKLGILGNDPFRDMKTLVTSDKPIILDVGANIGQSISRFRKWFENSTFHSFEPGDFAFRSLKQNTRHLEDVHINNMALGKKHGTKILIEHAESQMSSFLEPGKDCWGRVIGKTQVQVDTLDTYCKRKGISRIDILKTDTQGYDLEVIKGGSQLLAENRIQLIFIEIGFLKIYRDLPSLDTIYQFLVANRFKLVSFYRFNYLKNVAGWCDALFVNPQFRDH
jgi:FkbM family methyltransferase